jgi:hypothetical protein
LRGASPILLCGFGRSLWIYRDTQFRPNVRDSAQCFGCHHAREWPRLLPTIEAEVEDSPRTPPPQLRTVALERVHNAQERMYGPFGLCQMLVGFGQVVRGFERCAPEPTLVRATGKEDPKAVTFQNRRQLCEVEWSLQIDICVEVLTLRRQAIGYGVRARYGRRAAPRRCHACGQSRTFVRGTALAHASCARRCGAGAKRMRAGGCSLPSAAECTQSVEPVCVR